MNPMLPTMVRYSPMLQQAPAMQVAPPAQRQGALFMSDATGAFVKLLREATTNSPEGESRMIILQSLKLLKDVIEEHAETRDVYICVNQKRQELLTTNKRIIKEALNTRDVDNEIQELLITNNNTDDSNNYHFFLEDRSGKLFHPVIEYPPPANAPSKDNPLLYLYEQLFSVWNFLREHSYKPISAEEQHAKEQEFISYFFEN